MSWKLYRRRFNTEMLKESSIHLAAQIGILKELAAYGKNIIVDGKEYIKDIYPSTWSMRETTGHGLDVIEEVILLWRSRKVIQAYGDPKTGKIDQYWISIEAINKYLLNPIEPQAAEEPKPTENYANIISYDFTKH